MSKEKISSSRSSRSKRNRQLAQTGGQSTGPADGPLGNLRRDLEGFLASRGIRETVESIVVAFVLAFLFRTFEAEAFVIPTGSMAPTLQGRHKDYECPECGFRCRIGASKEVDQNTETSQATAISGLCPNCRYRTCVEPAQALALASHGLNPPDIIDEIKEKYYFHEDLPELAAREEKPSFSGDRILVNKFIYEFSEPRRWDVIVFRYPHDASRNYIKRLVGLPGETVRIHRGDIYSRDDETSDPVRDEVNRNEFPIARKSPEKIRAIAQIVYDNDFALSKLRNAGWPARWADWPQGLPPSPGRWVESEDLRSFSTDGTSERAVWLRYQHTPPCFDDWRKIVEKLSFDLPRPELISDTYAYNSASFYFPEGRRDAPGRHDEPPDPRAVGYHWVGDLLLECELEVRSASGVVVFELVEGGRQFRCRLDLATGQATLAADGSDVQFVNADGEKILTPSAATSLKGSGSYQVALANVDDQLVLWIDGDPVAFEGLGVQATYQRSSPAIPTSADLSPAGMASESAAVEIRHLRLSRDVYYIVPADGGEEALNDFSEANGPRLRTVRSASEAVEEIRHFLQSPESWPKAFRDMRAIQYPLARTASREQDQFLVLGDNSPQSKDSRLWSSPYYFERELLIGKAIFIYWPHPWNRPIPYFPNFGDMDFVE